MRACYFVDDDGAAAGAPALQPCRRRLSGRPSSRARAGADASRLRESRLHLIEMIGDAVDFNGRLLDRLGRAIRGLGRFVGGGLRLGGVLFGLLGRLLCLGGRGFGLLRPAARSATRIRRSAIARTKTGNAKNNRRIDDASVAARTPGRCACRAAVRRRRAAAGCIRERRRPSGARRCDRESCPRCPTPRSRRPAVGASVFKFAVSPSERLQIVGVVGQARHVGLHVVARRFASFGGVGFEDDGLRRT